MGGRVVAGRSYRLSVIGTGNTRQAQSAIGQLGNSAHKAGGMLKVGLAAAAASATAAVGTGLVVALREGWQELQDTQKANAQTAAAIKSTGGAARVTAQHVQNLSGALLKKSGIDDQVIQSGANMLLTFTNIRNEAGKGNDVFDQTTKAALDMSVALGTEPTKAAMQLGKALNDPEKGLTKLMRSGVTFTAQQKKQVKALQDSGHTLKAQKIILAEVNKEFGGSAKAYGNTVPGQIAKMREAFAGVGATLLQKLVPAGERVLEWIQRATAKGGSLRPIIDGLKTAFHEVATGVHRAVAAFKQSFGSTGQASAGMRSFAQSVGRAIVDVGHFAMRVLPPLASILGKVAGFLNQHRTLLKLLAVGFAMAVAPATTLAVGFMLLYERSKKFRDGISGLWNFLKSSFLHMEQSVLHFALIAVEAMQWIPGMKSKMHGAAAGIRSELISVQNKLDNMNSRKFQSAADAARDRWKKALADNRQDFSSFQSMIDTWKPTVVVDVQYHNPKPGPGSGSAAGDALQSGALPRGGRRGRVSGKGAASFSSAPSGSINELGQMSGSVSAGQVMGYSANAAHPSVGFLQGRIALNSASLNSDLALMPQLPAKIAAADRRQKKAQAAVEQLRKRVDQLEKQIQNTPSKQRSRKKRLRAQKDNITKPGGSMEKARQELAAAAKEYEQLTGKRDSIGDDILQESAAIASDQEMIDSAGPDQISGTSDDGTQAQRDHEAENLRREALGLPSLEEEQHLTDVNAIRAANGLAPLAPGESATSSAGGGRASGAPIVQQFYFTGQPDLFAASTMAAWGARTNGLVTSQ